MTSENVGILGGGFCLYGYLPAFIANGFTIVTLSKYKCIIESRTEISKYLEKIEFVESEEVILKNIDIIALARTPIIQSDFCRNNLESLARLRHVFLEKPLAPSQADAFDLLFNLDHYKIRFSVAYLFAYTRWFNELKNQVHGCNTDFHISWGIPIIEKSWKNETDQGGGLLKYYAIHLAHLISKLELNINWGESLIGQNEIKLRLEGGICLGIEIKMTNAKGHFSLSKSSTKCMREIFSKETPLGDRPRRGLSDPRVPLLEKYINAHLSSPLSSNNLEMEYRIWGIIRELENFAAKGK